MSCAEESLSTIEAGLRAAARHHYRTRTRQGGMVTQAEIARVFNLDPHISAQLLEAIERDISGPEAAMDKFRNNRRRYYLLIETAECDGRKQEEIEAIAKECGLSEQKIRVWFNKAALA